MQALHEYYNQDAERLTLDERGEYLDVIEAIKDAWEGERGEEETARVVEKADTSAGFRLLAEHELHKIFELD